MTDEAKKGGAARWQKSELGRRGNSELGREERQKEIRRERQKQKQGVGKSAFSSL